MPLKYVTRADAESINAYGRAIAKMNRQRYSLAYALMARATLEAVRRRDARQIRTDRGLELLGRPGTVEKLDAIVNRE